MNRQRRRAVKKHIANDLAENISEKISQFEHLPSACTACGSAFNKNDKECISTWRVVVREESVRLFCTECTQKVKDVLGGSDESTKTKLTGP
jgi:hypothetical protein